MSDTVTIRKATPDDFDAIGPLGRAIVETHCAFDPQRFIAAVDDVEGVYTTFLREQMASDDVMVLVAEKPGAGIVGLVYVAIEPGAFKELRDRAGFVHDVIVAEEVRGHGIGEQLLEAGVAWLAEQGVPRVLLWTAVKNEGAQRLFERHGFRKTMIEMTREV